MKYRTGFVTNSSSSSYVLVLKGSPSEYLKKVSLNAGEFEDSLKDSTEFFIGYNCYNRPYNTEIERYEYTDFIDEIKNLIYFECPIHSYSSWMRDERLEEEKNSWPKGDELLRLDELFHSCSLQIINEMEKKNVDFKDVWNLSLKADDITKYKSHTKMYSNIRTQIETYGGCDMCTKWAQGKINIYNVEIDQDDRIFIQIFDKLASQKYEEGQVIRID